MLTTALICAGIAAVTYIVRAAPRIGFPDYGADAFFHLALADVIRKHRDRQKFVRYFSIGGYNDYPLLLHYLLAVFPKKTLEKMSGYISPFFDALNAVLVYWLCIELTGSEPTGIAAWLFYLVSPQLNLESLSLTPRLLGVLLFNLWIVAMMVGLQSVSMPWVFISIFAGAACFHAMRAQLPLMLAAGPVLWAATGNPTYAVLEVCAFAAAFALNPKQFTATFVSYCIMTYDTGRNWRYYGDDRDRLDKIASQGAAAAGGRWLKFLKKEARMLFSYNPATWLMFAAGLWVSITGHGDAHLLMKRILWYWFLLAFVVFLLAERIPQLGQRSGDGYRQFPMFGALPGAVLAGIALIDAYKFAPVLFRALAAGFVVCYALTLRMDMPGFRKKLKASSSYISPELKTILKRVSRHPFGGVMCLPNIYNYPMIYFGDKRVVEVVERSKPYRNLVSTYYMGLKLPASEYIKMFDLDYFFVDTRSSWNKDMSGLGDVVEREGPFIFIKIKNDLK